MTYRRDIDGLRAIAVLSVLLYHANLGVPGGYVGVDVFFVISGFLICNILVREISTNSFSYTSFWERRIRRLMPALVAMMLACLVAGYFLLSPERYQDLGLSVASQPLLITNIALWRTTKAGYFGEPPESRPMLHTWSLAVEEQFYLLCPLLITGVYRLAGRRAIAPGFALVALGSWLLSGLMTPVKPVMSYFILPTRAFELLLGGLAWYAPPLRRRIFREVLGLGGLLVTFWSFFALNDNSIFPGWVALVPCLGTVALLIAHQPAETLSARWLASRPMVGIGLISYSLYLWHWPVISFWRNAVLPWEIKDRLLVLLLSLFMGWLSYRYVETPFRQRRLLRSRSDLFAAAGFSSAVCFLTGAALVLGYGLPQRWSPAALRYLAAKDSKAFVKQMSVNEILAHRFVHFGSPQAGLPKLFVWGDSHAMAALSGIDRLCKEVAVSGEAAVASESPPCYCTRKETGPIDTADQKRRCEVVVDYICTTRPQGVLLIARWDDYFAADYQAGLADTLAHFQKAGIPTWIASQVPRHRGEVPQLLACWDRFGRNPLSYGVPMDEHRRDMAPFFGVLDQLKVDSNMRIDPALPLLSEQSLYRAAVGPDCLYFDEDHLSVEGSLAVREAYRPAVEACARRRTK